ncbi:phosphotransferase enzyme family protein [Stachybotrys elegans]|uniref:Phosphotransferase enzyme family protein n=1 Tax=Stachybotrys elegans TaxID=80388 RepID=A0A8K0SSB3_9HYPO|nr:phosphotransferase enzyme family protein [Stachybotrys elegans]
MPRPQIPKRDVVEALCKENGPKSNGFAYSDEIWIKYGEGVTLAEAAIQRYVHNNVDPRIVHVPEVFDEFSTTRLNAPPITYIVMEIVKADDYATHRTKNPREAEEALTAIANAVRHIWDIPLPPNLSPGPFCQQEPVDRFFSDSGSGQIFNTLVELEVWINTKLTEGDYQDRVSFQGEQLCLCHCDLTQFNIMVSDRITILDWGFAGIYPRAFDEFALIHQYNLIGQKFAKGLHQQLFGPKPSKSMRAMALAARYHAYGW